MTVVISKSHFKFLSDALYAYHREAVKLGKMELAASIHEVITVLNFNEKENCDG